MQPVSSPVVPLLERAAVFAERRHETLAGNMANIDTPGYTARDLPVADFHAAMARAAESIHSPPPCGESPQRGESPSPLAELNAEALYRPRPAAQHDLTFQDGNNRSVEQHAIELSRNALIQRMSVELLAQQFQLLEAVIAGRA